MLVNCIHTVIYWRRFNPRFLLIWLVLLLVSGNLLAATNLSASVNSPAPVNSPAVGNVNLTWAASTAANVGGYIVYYGQSSRNYTASFDAGNNTSWSLPVLQNGGTYYFAVSVYDSKRITASRYSAELVVVPPNATFTASQASGVAPLAVTLTPSTTGTITGWQWNFGDGTTSAGTTSNVPTVTKSYANAGTYTPSLTVTGPTGSATQILSNPITVIPPPPTANFTASQTNGVAPFAVSFTPAAAGAITSWQWDFGDGTSSTGTGSTVTAAAKSYANAGSYTVSLTVTGPGGSTTQALPNPITVIPPPPTVDFTASQTKGVTPFAVSFTPTTTGIITSWQWNFGDGTGNAGTGSTVTAATKSYTNAGSYSVSLTVTGPGGSATQALPNPITVIPPPPTVDFSASQTKGVTPLAVSFTPATTGIITSWQWSFGDGTTSAGTGGTVASVAKSYTNAGSYSVSLTVTGPGGSATQTLANPITAVPPPPTVNFTASQTKGITPLAVSFTPTTTGIITNWQWSFGDGTTSAGTGSTVTAATKSYTNAGSYGVSLTVTGPGGSATQALPNPITVIPPPPTVDFTASQTKGVTPLAVSFTPATTGIITSWQWSFGDGTTNAGTGSTVPAATKSYANAGSYSVSLTVTGPGGSVTQTLANPITVVPPPPTVSFTASQTKGIAPLAVSFTPATTGIITSWLWNFGDGTTSAGTGSTVTPAAKSYANAGNFSASLTVTGPGGSATQTLANPISVAPPPPTVNFTASQNKGVAPLAVTFTPTTTGAITSWQWNFGDGTTNAGTGSNVPIAIKSYANAGSYAASLSVTGPGGSAAQTLPNPISVAPPPPTVDFTVKQTGSSAPVAVTFTPTTTGPISNWQWSFGDGTFVSGTTSTVPAEIKLYGNAGAYAASLMVAGPGGTATQTLSSPLTINAPSSTSATGSSASNTSGLVAAYGFDEANGLYVEDASGSGNYGVISGSSTRVANSLFGNALKLNGANNWVTVQNSPSLALATGMTLEAWVYPTVPMCGASTVIMKEGASAETYLLAANNNTSQPMSAVWTGSEVTVGGSTQVPPNLWTHLAATYDGQYQSLYVNGVLVNMMPQTGAVTTSSGVLRIGGNALWGGYFQGYIDEVRIYNRALTNAQIVGDGTTAIGVSNPLKFVAGDTNIESTVDSIPAGTAQAFKITPAATQTLTNIQVYLDASSTATKLQAAIYTSTTDGHPRALWGSTGILTTLQAGAWNSVSLSPLGLSPSQSYWIAILGTGGTLNLRVQPGAGTSVTEVSASAKLTSLPNNWTTGSLSTTGGQVSVYGAGY